MRVLFVYDNLYTLGGIQTWLTRVLPRLSADGHEVALLARPPGEAWDTTNAIVDDLSGTVPIHLRRRHWFKAPRSLRPPPPEADVLFACNSEALLVAALLQRHAMPGAKIVAGVFHPQEYCARTPLRWRRWAQHVIGRLVQRLPVENFVFCTPGTAVQMGGCLGRDLTAGPVLPLPIDTERLRPRADRAATPGKVVSIARLHPQYAHHARMIDVVAELRGGGHDFTYHAYGDGPERAALEDQARRLGVDDAVFLHGAVPHSRIPDVVGDAFAFVGTGTALLEAAACGVPALAALAGHSTAETHGFLQDISGSELGGWSPGHPRHSIAERLLWLAGRSAEEYARVERESRARAEEFDVSRVVPRLPEMLGRAAPFAASVSALDTLVGRLDWGLSVALLKLGVGDRWADRYFLDAQVEVPAAASSAR